MSFSGLTIRRNYEGGSQDILAGLFAPILHQALSAILYVEGARLSSSPGTLDLLKAIAQPKAGLHIHIHIVVVLPQLEKPISVASELPADASELSRSTTGVISTTLRSTTSTSQVRLLSIDRGEAQQDAARPVLTALFEDENGRLMMCEVHESSSNEASTFVSLRASVRWSWADIRSEIKKQKLEIEGYWTSAVPVPDRISETNRAGVKLTLSGPPG